MEVVHSLSINNLPQEPSHLKYINITNDLIMVLLQINITEIRVSITIPALTPVTISFNTNGDSVRPVSGTPPATINTYKGVATTIPTSTLTRQAYTFTGWNTAPKRHRYATLGGKQNNCICQYSLICTVDRPYVKPNIDEFLAYRVVNDQGGATPTVVSVGTTGFCKLSLVGGANYTVTSVSVQFGTAAARAMTKTGAATYHCCSVLPGKRKFALHG